MADAPPSNSSSSNGTFAQSLDFKYFLSCDLSLDVYVGIVRIDGVGASKSNLDELTASVRLMAQGTDLHAVARQTSLSCRKDPIEAMSDDVVAMEDIPRAGSNVSAKHAKLVEEEGKRDDYPAGCGVWLFDEWLNLPIKYSEIEGSLAKAVITVRGVGGCLIGGAVATLFDEYGRLRRKASS